MTNEMTAEEAIRWLDAIKKYYIHGGDEAYDKKRMKAIDKAIKALEPKPMEKFDDVKIHIQRLAGDYKCWDNRLTWEEALELNRMFEVQPSEDCISREHAKQFLYYEIEQLHDDGLYDCFSRIIDDMYNELPSVTPSYNSIKTELKTCEDCISRQKALDCFEQTNTRQGAKYAIETLLSVTPRMNLAETSQDCISREEMLKYQQYLHGKMSNEENHKLWNFIKGLPSVKPQYTDEEIDKAQAVEQAYVDKMVELAVEEAKRPKGKWIDDCGGVKCSCCGYSIDDDHYAKAYCTNCGAEMSGGEEE